MWFLFGGVSLLLCALDSLRYFIPCAFHNFFMQIIVLRRSKENGHFVYSDQMQYPILPLCKF